jgi:hypothetical protein
MSSPPSLEVPAARGAPTAFSALSSSSMLVKFRWVSTNQVSGRPVTALSPTTFTAARASAYGRMAAVA